MPEISPAQRTATTAKVILGAGIIAWGSALLQGSVVATVLAGVLLVFGGALLIAARREV
jgi:Ca2+/H+ antiporter